MFRFTHKMYHDLAGTSIYQTIFYIVSINCSNVLASYTTYIFTYPIIRYQYHYLISHMAVPYHAIIILAYYSTYMLIANDSSVVQSKVMYISTAPDYTKNTLIIPIIVVIC